MANTRQTLGDQETVDALVSNTLTSLEEDGITILADYSLYNHTALTSINFPNLTSTGEHCFDGCSGITSVAMPNVTNIKTYSFNGCTGLTSISLPEATTLGNYAFNGCTHLATVSVPKLTTLGTNAFQNCDALISFDVPSTVNQIPSNCFIDSGLTTLILRKDSMVMLANINAFSNTPIASFEGIIYVPNELVSTYRADSKWKNFFICSIDDYPVDISTLKPSSWAEVNTGVSNGDYLTWPLGITVPLTSGSYTFQMQLVAKDTDELSDNTGNAHTTWIARDIMFKAKMNSSNVATDGYAGSNMYKTTLPNLKAGIDETIQGYMKSVKKTWKDVTSSSTKTSDETFWIPSYREMFGGSSNENAGCVYTGFFTNAASKIKKMNGSASYWWLRSANSTTSFRFVGSNGGDGDNSASISNGVVPGFCI